METYYSRSFLKYRHIWKDSGWSHQIIGETVHQLDILYHQVEPPVPGAGYVLFNCWPKGPHGTPQTSQAIVKGISYSVQFDGKALIAEDTLTS